MSRTRSKGSESRSSRERKRARFQAPAEQAARRTQLMIVGGVVALVVMLTGVGLLFGLRQGVEQPSAAGAQLASSDRGSSASSAGAQARHAPVEAADGEVRLSLSTFDDGQAHYFSLVDAGRSIDFFVLKSSDGVVRAAFDACDVCFAARKGYHQEGDVMVCNNCGQQFPSARINEVRGGCNPAPLERRVDGSDLIINESDIATGDRYF